MSLKSKTRFVCNCIAAVFLIPMSSASPQTLLDFTGSEIDNCWDCVIKPDGTAIIAGVTGDPFENQLQSVFVHLNVDRQIVETVFLDPVNPLPSNTYVTDFSPDGEWFCGQSYTPGEPNNFFGTGFRGRTDNPNGFEVIDAFQSSPAYCIANSGTAFGAIGNPRGPVYRWDSQNYADVPIENLGRPTECSADGAIVVGWAGADAIGLGAFVASVWTPDSQNFLVPDELSHFTMVECVSPNGSFLGGFVDRFNPETLDFFAAATYWEATASLDEEVRPGAGYQFLTIRNSDQSFFEGEVQRISDSGLMTGTTVSTYCCNHSEGECWIFDPFERHCFP